MTTLPGTWDAQTPDCYQLAEDHARLETHFKIVQEQLSHEKERVSHLVKILSGIHALLPPNDVTTPDGKTWRFNYPPSLPADEVLRALAERIKAIPEDMDRPPIPSWLNT